MITTGKKEVDEQIKKLHGMGQAHIFSCWDELDDPERNELIEQVMEIDLALMKRLIEKYVTAGSSESKEGDFDIEPCTIIDREDDPRKDEAQKAGEDYLRQAKVCAFLVAGGQGTRLGFDGPKGAFKVGPVSERTLFQIHAEKIQAASNRYGVRIPWYIMTSKMNHEPTIGFFEENRYFGMNKDDVVFFSQAMIPAVDKQGKFFLSGQNTIFRNPNGHGGSIEALYKSGAVDDMKKRGIDLISYFQVDNCLVRIMDPVFIGYHILEKADMSSKVVDKRDPQEKVGVIGYVRGKLGVVEYSDLPDKQKYEKTPDGSLKYSAGSIAIHLLNRRFIEKENEGGFRLPFHKTLKKVPYFDKGTLIKPEEPNGIKFETFVFDALGDTSASVTLRTRREDEFSPVKNKEGMDSHETAQQEMSDLYKKWLEHAGFKGDLPGVVEISPLFADSAEELKRRIAGGMLYR